MFLSHWVSAYIVVSLCNVDTITLSKNCSAMQSYVQIVSPVSQTLVSSQALFPPYVYSVNSTEIVQLTDSDDVCDVSGLITDVSNKMILLWETAGNCTNHYKVHAVEQNGASSVLFVSGGISGVDVIADDDSVITHIPARMIQNADGIALSNTIETSEVLISFGCFADDYPSIVCVEDYHNITDAYWALEGDYQRQSDITINDHPIWQKSGYSRTLSNRYLYLNHANGDNEWYWAFAVDLSQLNKTDVYCTVGSLSKPSSCPSWQGTSWYHSYLNKTVHPHIVVHDEACTHLSDNHLCISSSQSLLDGLAGSYRLHNNNRGIWMRDINDCDGRPGILYFTQGRFELFDAYTLVTLAHCTLNSTFNTSWDSVQFIPTLCTDWISYWSGYSPDPTFTIEINTECDLMTCVLTPTAPDKLCFASGNAISFLGGEYFNTGVLGTTFATSEYTHFTLEYGDTFLWYHGEVSTWFPNWVLSSTNLTTAIGSGGASIVAFVECSAYNPLDCTSNWLSWNGLQNRWVNDYWFYAYPGSCATDMTLCFDDGMSNIYSNPYTGTYSAGSSSENRWWHQYYHMYYNKNEQHWIIKEVNQNRTDMYLFCESPNQGTPINCSSWHSSESNTSLTMSSDCVLPSTSPTEYYTSSTHYTSTDVSSTYEPTKHPSSDPTSHPIIIPTLAPTLHPTVLPTVSPTMYPSVSPTSQTGHPSMDPTHAPSNNPTSIFNDFYFICDYNDHDDHYYTIFMNLLEYAELITQQTKNTIETVTGYSTTYEDSQVDENSPWKRFGIINLQICSVFDQIELDPTCIDSLFGASVDSVDTDDDYTIIGTFGVVVDTALDEFKSYIVEQISSITYRNVFTENMQNALNDIEGNTAQNSAFTALSCKAMDTFDMMITTEYTESQDGGQQSANADDDVAVTIITVCGLVLLAIGLVILYFKKWRTKEEGVQQEGNNEPEIEMNNEHKMEGQVMGGVTGEGDQIQMEEPKEDANDDDVVEIINVTKEIHDKGAADEVMEDPDAEKDEDVLLYEAIVKELNETAANENGEGNIGE